MARCGCSPADVCNCVLEVDDTFTLSGSGSVANPWLLNLNITGWNTLGGTYANSYSAYSGSVYYVPQWRVLFGDVVQLRGRILKTNASVVGETIISGISTSIRPVRNKLMLVGSGDSAGDNGTIEILPSGTITCQSTLPDNFIQLDGLWYEVN